MRELKSGVSAVQEKSLVRKIKEAFAFTSETTVRVNQSQLKDWKRLLHAALRGILFNEALTDGLCLKSHCRAHPDTDRILSDNLYHSDKPHREVVEIGS